MTKLSFKLIIWMCVFTTSITHGQAYYGTLYEQGVETTLNWYIQGDQMCMEYIHLTKTGETELHARFYLNAASQELIMKDVLRPQAEPIRVHADSIHSTSNHKIQSMVRHTNPVSTDHFGACIGFNAKTHQGDYLLVVEPTLIELGHFSAFFKDDAILSWWSQQSEKGFPIQMVHVNPLGQVIRSVQFHRKEPQIPTSIF